MSLKSIIAKVKSWFSPTVESIIADVTAKVSKLNVVAAAKAEESKLHAEEIALRTKLAADADAVVAKADALVAKFEALVS